MTTALLDGNVTDQNGVAVVGALVYIYDYTGALAALTDSLGQTLANPVTSGEDGYWSSYVTDQGYYTLKYYWAGRLRYTEANRAVGADALASGVILAARDATLAAQAASLGSMVTSQNEANLASALYTQFKALFLGSFADDTSATNAATGGLTAGMLYVNTAATPILRIYGSGGWVNYDTSAQAAATLAASYGNMTAYKDYATLALATPAANTMGIVYYDSGTHTDPVTSSTGVANAGIYTYSTSPAGWKWLGSTTYDGLASQVAAVIAAANIPAGTPTQIGSTVGAVNPGSTFNSYGNSEPIKVPGLLTKFQFNMSGSATVNIVFYDELTLKVLKIFAGVVATSGVNTLASGTIANWSAPAGALAAVSIASGSGQLLTSTGATRPCARFTTTALNAVTVGGAMPAIASVAATAVDILIETTPTSAQGVDTRVQVIEGNEFAEDAVFVGREAYTTKRNSGITTFNAAATTPIATGRILLTPPLTHGMKAQTAFVNLNAAGSGELLFFRQVDNVPTYSFWKAVPVGPLVAGANTVTLPELDLPVGSVMGYDPVIGGALNSIGNTGRNAQYISTASFTGIIGSTYTTTVSSAFGALGFTGLGSSDRWAVSAKQGDLRRADNGRTTKPRLPTSFMIGVWDQLSANFATWKARGINTVIGSYADYADGNGPLWVSTAVAQGLQYVRRPGLSSLELANPAGQIISAAQRTQVQADVEYDAVQPLCIGWNSTEEPDGSVIREEGSSGLSPTTASPFYVEREIARWRQWMRTKPVFQDMQGFHIQFPGASIRKWMDLREPDVFGFDTYPNSYGGTGAAIWWGVVTVNPGLPEYFTTMNGACCEYLSQQLNNSYATQGASRSGGLPTYCYVPTSRVEAPCVAPTPGEFRATFWSAVIGGVIGIHYFPQDVTPGAFVSDASDANVLTEMATLHSNLAVMQTDGCLMDAVQGGRVPATKRLSVYPTKLVALTYGTFPVDSTGTRSVWQSPVGNQLQGGFEGLRIVGNNGVVYYLILNLVGEANTLTDTLWGISALAFAAYEIKFFTAAAPTTNLFTSSGL